MMIEGLPPGPDLSDEFGRLIETLNATDQRLEELTGGQVDAVVTRSGRTIMLQRSQDLLRQHEVTRRAGILDALPACIALVDTAGAITSVNKAWQQFARHNDYLSPGFGVGTNYLAVCDQAQGEGAALAHAVAVGMRAVLLGDLPSYSVEYACHSPGLQRWFFMTVSPLTDAKPTAAVVTHVDISQRMVAQLSTQRSTELLTAVISGTPDHVFVKDREGHYLLCNDAFAQFVGRTADQMIGKTNAGAGLIERDVLSVDASTLRRQTDLLVMTGGKPITTEDVLTGSAGTRTFLATKAPYRDEQGEVMGVIGISRDITDRKRAETELSESQALLRMASRLTMVGSWYVDLPAMHVVWSDNLALIHDKPNGFFPSVEQAVGYYAPEHRVGIRQAFKSCATEGVAFDVEGEVITAKGRRIWVRTVGEAVRGDNGAIRRVQGALQDLSERKRSELEARLLADRLTELNSELEARVDARTADLRQAREDAEQANRAKSAFLAAMSHEIRTPMNGVVGMIDVLEQSSLKSAQAEIVRTVRESAHALLRIVDDVLDFSKIEAGRFDIDREPMSLQRVVTQVGDTFTHLAYDKGVRLTIAVDPSIPGQVTGDALRLRQVLLNLVGNAIKFSSEEGRAGNVSLTAQLVALDATDCRVEFVIQDNGIGMDELTLKRLFEPFTQGDVGPTRRFGGTGLGLSISRRLTQLMGGDIEVASRLSEGSRFKVGIPFQWSKTQTQLVAPPAFAVSDFDEWADEASTAPMPLASLDAAEGPRLILVAEDNETNQLVICRQLELLGYQSDIAVTGRDALERWRQGAYLLLLTDLHMPLMDGFELASAVRAEEDPGRRMPIVALTANAARSEVLHGRDVGMDDHLIKPLHLIQLHAVLQRWMPSWAQPKPLRPARSFRTPRADVPPTPASVPVDLAILGALVGHDSTIINRMLASFRVTAVRARDGIRLGISSGKCSLVADAVHPLKSAAQSVGALRLADICGQIEASADAGRRDELVSQLAQFERDFSDVDLFLKGR